MPDHMPERTLWSGVAVSLLGALIVAFAPPVLFSSSPTDTEPGQTFLTVVLILLDLLRGLVLPLGTALVAASVVMFYIRRRGHSTAPDERPKRWVLPDPIEHRGER